MTSVDFGKARTDHTAYTGQWRRASEGRGSETFAIIAATRCADQLPAFVDLAERLLSAEMRLRMLHHPVDRDTWLADRRCAGCVVGYDPKTGDLVFAAWPCPTIQALDPDAASPETATPAEASPQSGGTLQ